MTQYVFLGHDVDWRKQGPSLEHILARRERFEPSILNECDKKNPYYNIPDYMEIEEKFDVKSTYFFRTNYEDGDFADYEDDMSSLIGGGWEVGLHLDPSSINDTKKILEEKTKLERISKTEIKSNRVHYLEFNIDLPNKLQELGFEYDSSIRRSKDRIDQNEMGYFKYGNLIEFPITIMDAYLFTYMKIKEDQIIPTFENTLNLGRTINNSFNVITVIWHDNVLKMKGGRMYKKILEYLTSQDDVSILRGIDLASMINSNK